MNQRFYHGKIKPLDLANALIGYYNRGNYRVQRVGDENKMVVQIATAAQPLSGGQTALSVVLQRHTDGVAVQIGEQAWLGVAASLGVTALSVLRNPISLLSRLDDLAQDIEHLSMTDEIWKVIESAARGLGATQQLSERLRRVVCAYCRVANPVGQGRCLACGAPLGDAQPRTCAKCGYVITTGEHDCPNCKDRP